jgi:hypothetical protein
LKERIQSITSSVERSCSLDTINTAIKIIRFQIADQ